MRLSNLACKNAKPSDKPRKLSDGQGLYLEVMPSGSKYWRLKYRFLGKEKRLALGVYPEVSLEEAREKRRIARKQLADNKDPGEQRRLEKLAIQLNYDNSFEAIAREWHENRKETWKPIHAANLLKRFEADVFPKMGSRPIADIKAPELLSVVRTVEARGAVDVARRILQTCGQIFRYAVATGRAERDVSVDLKGALKNVKVKNRAYLGEEDLPEFLRKLESYDGHPLTRLALQFLLLTFVRSGELRGATWDEINWDKAEWRIPAERMKMKEIHIVPLSKQAIATLEEIKKFTGQYVHVFANQQTVQRRLTITLAWLTPVNPRHRNYCIADLWFDPPDTQLQVSRSEAAHHAVKQGTVQHEILEGQSAVPIAAGDTLPIQVNCREDAANNFPSAIPYALMVSLETGRALPVYDQVHIELERIRAVARARMGINV